MKVVVAALLGCAIGVAAGVLVRPDHTDDRIERYCRLRELSLRDTRAAIERGVAGFRLETAQRLVTAMESRLAYDDLMRCSVRPFDLGRYRGCVAARDFACMVEVIREAGD